jgi:hydroxymethylpyrimidine pyrophosphatase-like HAD family hydrolase
MNNELNGSSIRALCTDIDGTLLDSRRELSTETIDAISKISLTMPVILASSRMPSVMRHVQKRLNILEHRLIRYNGGYVLKYEAGIPNPLYSVEIAVSVCAQMLALAKGTSVQPIP